MKRTFLFAVFVSFLPTVQGLADYVYDDTTLNGGTYCNIQVFGSAALDVYASDIDMLGLEDASTGRIHSGSIRNVFMADSSTLYLWGSQIKFLTANNAIIHFHAQTINFETVGFGHDTRIYGIWGDGTQFDIWASRTDTHTEQFIFHQIPEPATLLLLFAGSLLKTSTTNNA